VSIFFSIPTKIYEIILSKLITKMNNLYNLLLLNIFLL